MLLGMQDFDSAQINFLGDAAAFPSLTSLPHKNASAIRYLEHIIIEQTL